MDRPVFFGHFLCMSFGFREQCVLQMFAEGLIQSEVALAMSFDRHWITNKIRRDPLFALAYEAARTSGREE